MPTRLLPSVVLAAVLAATVIGAVRAPAQPFPAIRPTHADTVPYYTAEQAERGQAVYQRSCKECHELADLAGNDFRGKWNGRSVWELYEQIRTTMPDGNPGTLPRDEYADVLAYLFKANDLPAGPTVLAPDSAALSAAKLTLPARTR